MQPDESGGGDGDLSFIVHTAHLYTYSIFENEGLQWVIRPCGEGNSLVCIFWLVVFFTSNGVGPKFWGAAANSVYIGQWVVVLLIGAR